MTDLRELARLAADNARLRKHWEFLRGLIAERQTDIPLWLAREWVEDLSKRALAEQTA